MEYSTLMHAHKGIIYLFLFFFSFKVTLMFVSPAFFQKFREKTKVVEMVLGTLIVITGGWLLGIRGFAETWLIVKIVLVVIAMGLAIVGLKRNNKVLAVVALLIFIYIFIAATNKRLSIGTNAQINHVETNVISYHNFENSPIILNSTECASFHGNKNSFASIND